MFYQLVSSLSGILENIGCILDSLQSNLDPGFVHSS